MLPLINADVVAANFKASTGFHVCMLFVKLNLYFSFLTHMVMFYDISMSVLNIFIFLLRNAHSCILWHECVEHIRRIRF